MSPENKDKNGKRSSQPDLQRTIEGILERLRQGMEGLVDSLTGRQEPQPIPIPIPIPQQRRRG